MNALSASILLSAGSVNVNSTCSFSSSGLAGRAAFRSVAGDLVAPAVLLATPVVTLALGVTVGATLGEANAAGLSDGVAVFVSAGAGVSVVWAVACGDALGEGVAASGTAG